ncbi:glycerophosphodiester phosphodiesterase family protein [Flavobacterium branchiophilum]|uniref:Glycerophosphodiester phosphodiesterase n=1 Tax=Flavobacterium branchiophilum (strain FL-15) TaxID=1034807 RepID=G2Z2S2_FLABF|nr:glycerophosphodiester phosphodiesterase family protein [Flavobacterium branchiophilum]CCB70251.1 Glycerophosphodiester phosphodiesterase [Flavobacterium branchiophilum FL-15]
MLKLGHRGAKGYEPENTLVSFQKALLLGANGIELDVQLTKDNVLVVMHDESVDRTTNGTGLVKDFLFKEIQSLRINNQHPIPSLEQVLTHFGTTTLLNIELKAVDGVDVLLYLLNKKIKKQVISYKNLLLSSFNWQLLQQLRFENHQIPIGILTETNLDLAFHFAKFMKAENLHPYYHLLNQENVATIQQKNIKVITWTVNHIEEVNQMKQFGVSGIISDFPDII